MKILKSLEYKYLGVYKGYHAFGRVNTGAHRVFDHEVILTEYAKLVNPDGTYQIFKPRVRNLSYNAFVQFG